MRRMRRRVGLLCAVGLMTAACGGGEAETDPPAGEAAGEEPAAEEPAAEDPAEEPAEEEPAEEVNDEEAVAEGIEPSIDPEVLPFDRIRYVIPFGPGGGQETQARYIQPYLAAHLGKTIQVETIPGGNTAVGSAVAARDGGDCSTVLQTPIPHLQFAWLTQDADFTWEDFVPVAHYYREGAIVAVAADSEYETMEDLLAAARESPGEISFSISAQTSPFYIALLDIERVAGVDFNIVSFDGGSAARNAVVSGEVDGTHVSVLAAQNLIDEFRVLAVHQDENRWPDLIPEDTPLLEDVLGEDIRPTILVHNGVFVSKECRENHPERYEALVEGIEAAATDPTYQEFLQGIDQEARFDYLPPDEFEVIIEEQLERLREEIERVPELERVENS